MAMGRELCGVALGEGVEWRRYYGQKSNTRRICRKIKKEKS